MSDQLNATLVSILQGFQVTAVNALQFVQQQAPELVKEIIIWGAVSSIYYMWLGAFFIVVGAILFATDAFNRFDYIGPSMIGTVLFAIGILIVACNAYTYVQVIYAPKLYLIQYISGFLHGVR